MRRYNSKDGTKPMKYHVLSLACFFCCQKIFGCDDHIHRLCLNCDCGCCWLWPVAFTTHEAHVVMRFSVGWTEMPVSHALHRKQSGAQYCIMFLLLPTHAKMHAKQMHMPVSSDCTTRATVSQFFSRRWMHSRKWRGALYNISEFISEDEFE